MNRIVLAAWIGLGATLASACSLPTTDSAGPEMGEIRLTAAVAGTPINLIVVICKAADIPTPLVFNLTAQNGVAQGTIRLPPGKQRTITVQGFDADGNLAAEGSKTIDVKPGQNPPVSIPLITKAGQVLIIVTLGPVSVVVQPAAPTVQVGATQQLTVTITAPNGDILPGPAEWATANPTIATVDQNGNVTGLRPGSVDIVATFEGVAGVSHGTVGSQIAFVLFNSNIYIMNADGTNQTPLTNNGAVNNAPAWSPDGVKIAFQSTRDGKNQIYVMNADGTGVVRLTNDAADDEQPAWSPDGSRIAFASNRDGNFELYVMNADGTQQTRLTNSPAFDGQPTWSPDGMQIAFVSERDGQDQIYVMKADGSGVTPLTSNPAQSMEPAWSPDGATILFQSLRDGNVELYTMHTDGTGIVRLTNNPAFDGQPAWSPSGVQISFASSRDAFSDIYVMNADGTGVVRVTSSGSANEPRWRPR